MMQPKANITIARRLGQQTPHLKQMSGRPLVCTALAVECQTPNKVTILRHVNHLYSTVLPI